MSSSSTPPTINIPGYSYDILLGRGGMGAVYRGMQLAHRRPVAIKVLAEAHRDDPGFVARFQREAEILVALEHPNIVPMLDRGIADGVPYVVMRLIDGPSLRELIRNAFPQPAVSMRILTGVSYALDFAHAHEVLHRDVKPHNILVDHGGHAWLADFGLMEVVNDPRVARESDDVPGTPDYLAPEVAAGGEATVASDIYALAVTAFQALTATLPFIAMATPALRSDHASEPRPLASRREPSLPQAVDAVLARGMAIDPAQRPQSAVAFADELARALGYTPAPATSRPRRLRERSESALDQAPSTPAASDAHTKLTPAAQERTRGRFRGGLGAMAMSVGVAVVAALVLVFILIPGPRHASGAVTGALHETPGNATHSFANYRLAEDEGAIVPGHHPVLISCRLHGFPVNDGDTWWYRVAAPPWNDRYYVSADAFYNNGRSEGTLLRTPFVDPRVPICAAGSGGG